MIKAVLFDFGQTLVDSADAFRAAEKEAQLKIFADLSLNSPEDFLRSYREIRTNLHENSNFSRADIWQAVYLNYKRHPNLHRLEQWEREYWEIVESGTTIFPETENVLTELSANYHLGLITNTQGQMSNETHRLSRFPQLESSFDTIIVAGEAGIPPKPDQTPFLSC